MVVDSSSTALAKFGRKIKGLIQASATLTERSRAVSTRCPQKNRPPDRRPPPSNKKPASTLLSRADHRPGPHQQIAQALAAGHARAIAAGESRPAVRRAS